MRKKTLCLICDIFIFGGVESVVLDVLPSLSMQYETTLFVLTGRIDEELRARIPRQVCVETGTFHYSKINELIVQLPVVSTFYFQKQLRKKYDILIALKPSCRMAGISHIGRNSIYWNHSDHDTSYYDSTQLSFLKKINRIRLGRIYKKYNEIWFVNKNAKELCERVFGLTNAFLMPNPIDVDRILKASRAEAQIDKSDSIITLCMVGRLSEAKGFDRVISALGELNNISPYRVIIIGDGPERMHLKSIVTQYGLEKKVYFLGALSNPYRYIKEADLVICPSRTESFGIVLLEAMLLQVPVLTTRTYGTEFVTQDGKYGV